MWRIIVALVVYACTTASSYAMAQGKGWAITTSASLTGFRGAASDRAEDGEFTVRPSQGIAVGIGVARGLGPWGVSFGVSQLSTEVEAVSSEVAVRERTQALDRVRFALTAGRRLTRVGSGRLDIRGGVTLDSWSVAGDDERTVAGGEAGLALQLPAGRLTVEHVLGIGWTAGPFHASELPAGYHRQALRAVTAGVGLRFGL